MSREKSFIYKFPASGDYQLDVIVTDKNGKKAAKSRHFKAADEKLSFKFGVKPNGGTSGNRISYFINDLKGGVSPYKIKWVVDGKVVGEGKKGKFTLPSSERNILTVSVEDSRGELKIGFLRLNLNSSSKGSLDFKFWWTRSNPILGQSVRFGVRDITGGTPPFVIKWTMNGENIGEGKKIRYRFNKTGKNILKVTVTDSSGKSRSATKDFDVSRKPER